MLTYVISSKRGDHWWLSEIFYPIHGRNEEHRPSQKTPVDLKAIGWKV
jgi:hypothetical protein